MAFQQFTFPKVLKDLGLTLSDADLFAGIPEELVQPDFRDAILDASDMASAMDTEKARSEFVIAPVLMELRRRHRGAFKIFSGVELVGDPTRGLNGICDFLLANSPSQYIVTGPILSVVEAKNDNTRSGFGQCIASMVAAQIVNGGDGGSRSAVYGVVSSGSLWKFLKLTDAMVTIDAAELTIVELGKILAILGSIVTSSAK